MGCGKTLQATAIMAAASAEAAAKFASSRAPSDAPLPSLVVCPSTLVHHWAHEVPRYVEGAVLSPLPYGGTPAERVAAQRALGPSTVLIMSYESLRRVVLQWGVCAGWRKKGVDGWFGGVSGDDSALSRFSCQPARCPPFRPTRAGRTSPGCPPAAGRTACWTRAT